MILPPELADPDQRASLEDRVRAARDLGERDPRIGAEVAITAGPFVAGSDGTEGDEREQPRREAHTSAFAIDLVPVTVLQMARFLAASPYADRALWSDAGWEWSRRSGVDRPRFWGEAAWAAYFGGNQPVVGV